MAENSAIEWTDHTFNPWWGCARVSPACNNCYAETFAKRLGKDLWGKSADRRFFGDNHWNEPLAWNRRAEAEGEPHFVFSASMADVFEDRADLNAHRGRLWALIDDTPWLTWLLLTKRPEMVAELAPAEWYGHGGMTWPHNVWIGTTVEDQQRADERVPTLLQIPAVVRFLSCEPLLGSVDLDGLWGYPGSADGDTLDDWPIQWVIAGGESGAGHRPPDPDWLRSLRDQCEMAGAAFFFKQWGGRTPKAGGKELDGRQWSERPAAFLPLSPERVDRTGSVPAGRDA